MFFAKSILEFLIFQHFHFFFYQKFQDPFLGSMKHCVNCLLSKTILES